MARRMAAAIGLVAVVGSVAFLAPTASAQGCEPTPLPCSEILVDLPYSLDFGSDHGGVDDRDGVGTGFTYVEPTAIGTGYIPNNLFADTAAGKLRVTTTAGRRLRDANAQDNALAVGIDAPSQVTRIETTVEDPPAGTGQNQQAGVWFGNDEDNFAQIGVISRTVGAVVVTQIEFRIEVGSISNLSTDVIRTDPLDLAGKSVTLSLVADPGNTTLEGSYRIDGGDPVAVGSFIAPPGFFSFDGARIDPEIGTDSFGGIYTSHAEGPAPLTYTFDGFSVVKERDVVPPAPTVLPGGIAFKRAVSFVPNPTSLAFGPDGRLYVSEMFGPIHALTLDEDGKAVDDEVITTLGDRLTLGLTVDPLSTPSNVILWASNSSPDLVGTPNTGAITRLSGAGFATKEDVITGLPRALANHATNSIHFGPDGRLYIAQGGNQGAGAPSDGEGNEFGLQEEQPLSAALLVADVRSPTFDGSCAPPPCDVTTYATGLRNTYDFVFHSNGEIYGPDNGSGVDNTYPASPTPPCDVASVGISDHHRFDADPPGHSPGNQPDTLNLIEEGRYYGHPNPSRDQCVFEDGSFQGVAPLPNYEPEFLNLGFNRSANGIIEYQSDAHCGTLKGDLLMAEYSLGDDIRRIQLSGDGQSVVGDSSVATGFNEPLPLVEGPDGTIFVGEFSSGIVTALKPLDAGCWTEEEQGPVALLDPGSAALGGKLYVVAGQDSGGRVSTVRIFDPATGSWSLGPPLPGPAVENPAVVADGGKLYVFGGSASGSFSGTTNAAVFDPATNAWTELPEMPTARGGAMAQALDGKIYVAGGLGTDCASHSSVDVFDPDAGASGSWSSSAPMATRRDNAGSAVLDGKLYVFGGGTRDACTGGYTEPLLTSVEMYDPGTDSWTPRADMPTGRRSMATGTLDGRAQLIGGERKGADDTFAENEEYDPATDTWRTLTPMRTPRHGAAFGTIGDEIFVAFGGPTAGSDFSAVNESFAFADQQGNPPEPPNPPVTPETPTTPTTVAPPAGEDPKCAALRAKLKKAKTKKAKRKLRRKLRKRDC